MERMLAWKAGLASALLFASPAPVLTAADTPPVGEEAIICLADGTLLQGTFLHADLRDANETITCWVDGQRREFRARDLRYVRIPGVCYESRGGINGFTVHYGFRATLVTGESRFDPPRVRVTDHVPFEIVEAKERREAWLRSQELARAANQSPTDTSPGVAQEQASPPPFLSVARAKSKLGPDSALQPEEPPFTVPQNESTYPAKPGAKGDSEAAQSKPELPVEAPRSPQPVVQASGSTPPEQHQVQAAQPQPAQPPVVFNIQNVQAPANSPSWLYYGIPFLAIPVGIFVKEMYDRLRGKRVSSGQGSRIKEKIGDEVAVRVTETVLQGVASSFSGTP
jgi:hypothetical protein